MSHQTLLSTLVRQHLPEFIREDYQTFVKFIEAYYEFMEQTNGAMDFSKHLLSYRDVDRTLTEFEEYFSKTFLPLLSNQSVVDKRTLIKSAKQLYDSKGTKKSFEFLFRALYGEDVSIFYPKDNILRASDGKWVRRESVRVDPTYFSFAEGDGLTSTFRLFEIIDNSDNLSVYIDSVLQTGNYSCSLNAPTITFVTPPVANAEIKFAYHSNKIVSALTTNAVVLELTGNLSGAKAISERASVINIKGISALEIFITPKSVATFQQSEILQANYYYTDTDFLTLHFQTLSVVGSISVIDGGANYNVGDPVLITGGTPDLEASAAVEAVYRALITKIFVRKGGAGFKSGESVDIISTPNTGLLMSVFSVDTSEYYHLSTLTINTDIIGLYQNVVLSNTNYGFPVSGSENVNTVIANAFTFGTIAGLGPITNVAVLSSTFEFETIPLLKAASPTLSFTSTNAFSGSVNSSVQISDLGILGRMSVVSPGANYCPGDELIFINTLTGRGVGAAGEVTEVSANGGIRTVKFQPPRLSGTISTAIGGIQVIGTNTNFQGELAIGDRIEINNESRYVNSISGDTLLTVNVAWTKTSTNRRLGLYGRNFIGGSGYDQSLLPTVQVLSSNPDANGAIVAVEAIYGSGDDLVPVYEHRPGEIRSIVITTPGSGYMSVPDVDLSQYGDGAATAIASLLESKFTYPGRFLTTDSLLSSDRYLEDANYYQNFSYVLQSKVDLAKYKQTLLDLLHPAGMKFFGEYLIDESLTSRTTTIQSDSLLLETTFEGTVNVSAGSVYLTGTNTHFLMNEYDGSLLSGYTIQVNNELRVVNTIINNTSLTVTSTFTYTANDQVLIVYTPISEEVSNTLTTQLGDYIITQDENYLAYK